MINIKSITIHNFNSIEDLYLEFKEGVHLIVGKNLDSDFTDSNGSGKSSIVEALVYALYGKSLKSNHQRKGTDDTFVKLVMQVNDKFVEITRFYNHKVYKNKLQLFINGENITAHTQKQTQQILQNLIKMPFEHFISSIAIIQGFPEKLLTLTPTKRKEYFIDLIDFNFDEIIKQIKFEIMSLEEELNNLYFEKSELEKRKSNIEGQLSVLMSVDENISKNEDLLKLQKKFKEKEKEYNTVLEALQVLNKKHSEYLQEYTNKKSSLEIQLKQLEQIINNGKCPVCYSEVSKDIKEKYDVLKEELNSLKTDFKGDVYEKNIKELMNKKNMLLQEKTSLFEKIKQTMNNLQLLKEHKEKIDKLMRESEDIKNKLEDIEDKIFKLEDDKQQYKELQQLFSPSGELRSIVLSNYVDMYNQVLKTILKQLNQKEFEFTITDKGIEVKGIDYYSLSGGEKRKLDIITQLAFSDFLQILNNVDFNIRIYDEIFDNLDKKAYMHILSYMINIFYDKSVYFISHNDNLKSQFSSVITITKEKGISKLLTMEENQYVS